VSPSVGTHGVTQCFFCNTGAKLESAATRAVVPPAWDSKHRMTESKFYVLRLPNKCLGDLMKNKFNRRIAFQSAAITMLSALTSFPKDTYAQAVNPAQTVSLEEVTVTARRMEEDIQQVPVTVTALSGEQLKVQNIKQATDLQFAAPSLTVANGLGRLGGGAGTAGGFTVRGLNAGVVTYFNEVPGGPTQLGMPFFDEASVQVLNGPQGTLFGRTAAAGAVLITPQHPDLTKFSSLIDVTTGDYGRLQGTAVLNLPLLTDKLAFRIAYNHDHIDGFTKQIAPTQTISAFSSSTIRLNRELDEVNSDSVRVSLELHLGDFRNYLVYNYIDVNQAPPGQILSYANPRLGALNPASPAVFNNICNNAVNAGLPTTVAQCTTDRYNVAQQLRAAIIEEQARIRAGGDSAVRSTPAFQGTDQLESAVHNSAMDVAEFDFGDLGFTTLRAKNIFSYQENSGVTGYQLDGVGGINLSVNSSTLAPQPFANIIQTGNLPTLRKGPPATLITEEFQLQGNAFEMVDWTLGYYYQTAEDHRNLEGVGSMSRSLSGIYNSLFQNFVAAFPYQDGSKSKEDAAYGQITVDLDKVGVHGLSLTGGYRETTSETAAHTRAAVDVLGPGSGQYVPGAPAFTPSNSSGYNYMFGVNEQITSDVLVYATTSRSFVPGGVNVTIGCNVAPGCKPTYDPSIVKNYELGAKSQFELGAVALRLNGAIYRMDFSNIQQSFRFTPSTPGATPILYTGNVAEARMQGFEAHLEGAWSNLDFSLNYAYVDATYQSWVGGDPNNVVLPGEPFLIDLHDNPFVNVPEQQTSGTVRYHLPIEPAKGDFWASITAYHQSRQYHVVAANREIYVANTLGLGDVKEAISQKPYTTFNFRLGWDNILDSDFGAAVFVNNLTDETYSQSGGARLYAIGSAIKLYAPPRMWGVNLNYKFGK